MRKKNQISEMKLDPFEADLEKSFAQDTWKEIDDLNIRKQAIYSAKATKSERTNIRLSHEDVVGIKKKAEEFGLGYQTLIASIIHRYVTGRLVDVDTIRI